MDERCEDKSKKQKWWALNSRNHNRRETLKIACDSTDTLNKLETIACYVIISLKSEFRIKSDGLKLINLKNVAIKGKTII